MAIRSFFLLRSAFPIIYCAVVVVAVGQLGNGLDLVYPNWKEVTLLQEPIVHIAAGDMHNLVIGYSGSCYSWGMNAKGQLGIGSTDNSNVPVRVRLPFGTKARLSSCGFRHSLVLSQDNRMYSFGSNSRGQLGNGNCFDALLPYEFPAETWRPVAVHSGRFRPTPTFTVPEQLKTDERFVASDDGVPFPIQMSAGGSHSLVLTTDHVVFGFGNGSDGRLGLADDIRDKYNPVPIIALASKHIVLVAAGESHSFVVTSKRELFR